ncbi:amino acid ABC transporter substrate-binding protein [Cohnella caldifontis]|uniref:amino acid ABC transporter substrate-binding protein n=1 Tax=Cohnella caldifontis TaxID=3027471 RepID=UPI0023EC66F3|nr:amino acid ABC transporter substrate-binding protein [Cohnella sp. YIM B05605]
MKKLNVTILLLLAFAVVLGACGKRNDESQGAASPSVSPSAPASASAPAANASLLDTIKANGTIRIGTEGTYAPFTFHDKDGKLTGFDVEIAEEVAKRLGVKAEFIETKWDGMFAGLDAKRFDAVANEVSIRDDRKEKYDFSNPYIVSKAVLIVHQDNNDIKKLADLKGKKAGQSLTSNLTDIAKANGAEIVQTEGFNQAIELLLSKRIDATVNDGLSFLDFKKQQPNAPIKIVDETSDASESGFLFNKGNPELVDAVNKALDAIKEDGTYLRISEKYFGADVSK